MLKSIFAGLTFGTLLAVNSIPVKAETPPQRIVLPKDAVPLHYDLTIRPDAAALNFTGDVVITFTLSKDTNALTLNAANLTFGATALDDMPVSPKVDLTQKDETVRFTLPSTLKAGTHKLSVSYAGKIEQTSRGLFTADYRNEKGPQRLLVTQFEPSDARRFLPCFDEPGMKATFKLTSIGPTGQMAISNMPVEKTEPAGPGLTRVIFQTSPKMSSYLLFYGLGDFERKSVMVDGIDIGVVTKRGDIDKADFALEAAKKNPALLQ